MWAWTNGQIDGQDTLREGGSEGTYGRIHTLLVVGRIVTREKLFEGR